MYLLVIFTLMVVCVLCAYSIARFGVFTLGDPLSRSATNPYLWLALLLTFFVFDFFALANSLSIPMYEEFVAIDESDVIYAMLFFTLSVVMFFLGVVVSGKVGNPVSTSRTRFHVGEKSATITFVLVVLLLFITLASFIGSLGELLAGSTTRQVYFKENKAALIAFSMVCPAFALWLVNVNPLKPTVIFVLIGLSASLVLSGSRGALLLIILIWGYRLNEHSFRIPSWLYIPLIPIAALILLVLRFFFRESFRYDSIFEFIEDRGGIFSVFFDTAEISMAESITAIFKLSDIFNRWPFESFLAALMYPLPRSVFEWKPISSDALVTSILSPMRWEATQSEIVTTGFADFYIQFGYVGALIACLATGYIWSRLVIVATHLAIYGVFVVPFLMWWMYLFLRSGVFNMAGSVWPWLLVLGTAKMIDKFVRKK